MFMSCFQRKRLDCKIESLCLAGGEKENITASVLMVLFSHCNTAFEAMGCFYHCRPTQDVRPSLVDEDCQRGIKKREVDELGEPIYTSNKDHFHWNVTVWIVETVQKTCLIKFSSQSLFWSWAPIRRIEKSKFVWLRWIATMKNPWNWEPIFLASLHCSRTICLAKLIFIIHWKRMPKKMG